MTTDSLLHEMRRFLGLHRRYRRAILLAAGLMLLETLMAITLLYLPRYIFDTVIPKRDFREFWMAVGAFAMAMLLKEGVALWHRFILISVHNKVSLALTIKMVLRIYSQPVSFIDANQSGYLRARIMADVKSLDPISVATLMKNVVEVMFMGVSLAVLFSLNYRLAFALMGVLVIHTLTVCLPYWRIARNSAQNSENWARANTLVQDKMQGLRTTVLFNKQHAESQRIGKQLSDATDFSVAFLKNVELLNRAVSAAGSIGLFLVLAMCLNNFMAHTMTTGEVVTFIAYSTYFLNSTSSVFVSMILISATKGPLTRVLQVLDTGKSELQKSGHPAALRGHIEFDHVGFSYADGSEVLRDLSFQVRQGERVAIMGRSGTGKTTILNMLLGLYEPTAGHLRFDGVDGSELSKSSVRRQIAYVSQDTFFFNGSIHENICYSKWDAGAEEMMAAAHAASLDSFVDLLPARYETPIGELGGRLSGGQRQRMGIARAFLLNPPIILLDEATCHQDQINEQVILDAVGRIADGKTLIVVTHSSSVLRMVERILLLDEGRIVAEGVHEDLYASSQLYRSLCESPIASPAAPKVDTGISRETAAGELALT